MNVFQQLSAIPAQKKSAYQERLDKKREESIKRLLKAVHSVIGKGDVTKTARQISDATGIYYEAVVKGMRDLEAGGYVFDAGRVFKTKTILWKWVEGKQINPA